MYIIVNYKDAAELSLMRIGSADVDLAVEKTLLVNPWCPVRIMLEYIRKVCKLGPFTNFDLCEESGAMKGLFNMPSYAYATDQFENGKQYYLIVFRQDTERRLSVLPQLNWENRMYTELKNRVKHFLMHSGSSTSTSSHKNSKGSKGSKQPSKAPSGKSSTKDIKK